MRVEHAVVDVLVAHVDDDRHAHDVLDPARPGQRGEHQTCCAWASADWSDWMKASLVFECAGDHVDAAGELRGERLLDEHRQRLLVDEHGPVGVVRVDGHLDGGDLPRRPSSSSRRSVVVFFTTSVTWTVPQRSAWACEPETVFFTRDDLLLRRRLGRRRAVAAATALPTGRTSATALTAAVMCLVACECPFSECEAFGMDVATADAGAPDVSRDDVGHRRRAADVDVALGDVGDELAQVRRVTGSRRPSSVAWSPTT